MKLNKKIMAVLMFAMVFVGAEAKPKKVIAGQSTIITPKRYASQSGIAGKHHGKKGMAKETILAGPNGLVKVNTTASGKGKKGTVSRDYTIVTENGIHSGSTDMKFGKHGKVVVDRDYSGIGHNGSYQGSSGGAGNHHGFVGGTSGSASGHNGTIAGSSGIASGHHGTIAGSNTIITGRPIHRPILPVHRPMPIIRNY